MPLIRGRDYFKFGVNGKKYYYVVNNKRSRELAKAKAMLQGRAIEWRKHN